ncbi:hypothetical protein HAQ00_00780 [Acidithiobacillus caldus ATCC 51756]|uniref:hypothetical protein n=1 Tax=Acidithiobacillus caldus TaxID=33059 RepID=UPI001C0682DA|nr:hypothetical protein [Acidithiobacillus caldus]MBU2734287.1 hypothetical protein [Acidithiobacillus caldus ATCC 51756]MBU2801731.1 hypothetical protein [Acidithiobacillus caldus]
MKQLKTAVFAACTLFSGMAMAGAPSLPPFPGCVTTIGQHLGMEKLVPGTGSLRQFDKKWYVTPGARVQLSSGAIQECKNVGFWSLVPVTGNPG